MRLFTHVPHVKGQFKEQLRDYLHSSAQATGCCVERVVFRVLFLEVWSFFQLFWSFRLFIKLWSGETETAPNNRGFVLLQEDHSNTFLRLVICVSGVHCTANCFCINHYRIQAVFVLSHSHIPAIKFWVTAVPHLMKNNGLNKGLSTLVLEESNRRRRAHHTCPDQYFLPCSISVYSTLYSLVFCKDVWGKKMYEYLFLKNLSCSL